MKRLLAAAMATASLVLVASQAFADPIVITDDDGYSRLARWEQHLDDVLATSMRTNSIDSRRGWRLQKDLDSIEAHVLQSYYISDNGIDFPTFRRYASQLRNLSQQLGDSDWGARNVYGNGWHDDNGGYGPPSQQPSYSSPPQSPPAAYGPPPSYYRQGDYERSCHNGNTAAGTIFGAIAGGLIGGAASHGNGGAIAGGVVVGGLLGNALSRDVPCDDHSVAFNAYSNSLNGDIGRDYRWQHGNDYGTFTATREYRDGPALCRDFHAVTYRDGQRFDRDGTACQQEDGNWRTR